MNKWQNKWIQHSENALSDSILVRKMKKGDICFLFYRVLGVCIYIDMYVCMCVCMHVSVCMNKWQSKWIQHSENALLDFTLVKYCVYMFLFKFYFACWVYVVRKYVCMMHMYVRMCVHVCVCECMYACVCVYEQVTKQVNSAFRKRSLRLHPGKILCVYVFV